MSYKFTYTRLLVANFEACFLFYRDVMGFKVTWGAPEDVYGSFDTGQTILALFDRLAMSKAVGTSQLALDVKAQDRVCLCFEVENVDASCQQLAKLGIPLLTEPMDRPDWGIRTAHFRDPDGNLIEISQGLPPA